MDVLSAIRDYFGSHSKEWSRRASFLVACSGGPDSVALAWALKLVFPAGPYRFVLGHVNHKLRPGAAERDAAFVRTFATRLEWRCRVTVRPVPRKGNIEEGARVERYAALDRMAKDAGCAAVLTGHTLDDQAETILMNVARGAGPDGLAGMAAVRRFPGRLPVGRPLLQAGKDEVTAFLKREHLSFRRDRTNEDRRLTRNWYRSDLLPHWEARSPGLKERLATLARIFRDEASFWAQVSANAAARCLSGHGQETLDYQKFREEPPAIQRRLVRSLTDADLLTFDHIERLRRWMASPPSDGRFFQLRKGWTVERLSKSKGAPTATLFRFSRQPAGNPSKTRVRLRSKRKLKSL